MCRNQSRGRRPRGYKRKLGSSRSAGTGSPANPVSSAVVQPPSGPPPTDGIVSAPSPDWQLFSAILGIALTFLIPLFQANGVDVNWTISLSVYLVILGVCDWTLLKHALPHKTVRVRIIGVLMLSLTIGSVDAYAVINQYRRDNATGMILKAAQAIAVGLTDDPVVVPLGSPLENHYSGTGFFVDNQWHVIACAQSSNRPDPTVAIPLTSRGKGFFLLGSVSIGSKILSKLKGLILLKLQPNGDAPDTRRPPVISSEFLNIGDKVFSFGLELGQIPSFSLHEGVVTRLSSPVGETTYRIYATLPFKQSYCGAPVFNVKGEVVAVVESSVGDEEQLIPSQIVLDMMADVTKVDKP